MSTLLCLTKDPLERSLKLGLPTHVYAAVPDFPCTTNRVCQGITLLHLPLYIPLASLTPNKVSSKIPCSTSHYLIPPAALINCPQASCPQRPPVSLPLRVQTQHHLFHHNTLAPGQTGRGLGCIGQRTRGPGPPQNITAFAGNTGTALTCIFAECLQTWLSGI